jgi:hypothetical protein
MVEPRCTKQVIDHDQKTYGYARENAPVVAVVVTNAAAASARRDEAMHPMQTIKLTKPLFTATARNTAALTNANVGCKRQLTCHTQRSARSFSGC